MDRNIITEADIEPPVFDENEGDDGGDTPSIGVHVTIVEADYTRRNAFTTREGELTDDEICEMIMQSALGCARMRGPELERAMLRAMYRHSRPFA